MLSKILCNLRPDVRNCLFEINVFRSRRHAAATLSVVAVFSLLCVTPIAPCHAEVHFQEATWWMHPDLGSSRKEKWCDVLGFGELIESKNGQLTWIGQSRTNPQNKQFVVMGNDTDSDVLVRLDFNEVMPHVNIQVGDKKGKHTPVKTGDTVIVEIKDGKVRVLVNGEVKDQLPAPKGAKEGTIEVNEDGTIQVKDKDGNTIAVHQPEKKPQKSEGEEANADDAKFQMVMHGPRHEPLINVPAEPLPEPLINVPAEQKSEPLIKIPAHPNTEPLINVPANPQPQTLINVPHPPSLIMLTWRLGQGAIWKQHPIIPVALQGDWQQLLKRLDGVTHERGDAIQRHLKAHACLATNHNNESFRLFASATDADLADWRDWSAGLAATSPKSSYAHFFHADALARLGNNADAIAAFDKAIELDEKNALALHARGVFYAQMEEFDEAVKNIAAAQALSPNIADFQNSRGMLQIAERKGNVVHLEQQFDKAIAKSPDFAIAHHALGCVKLLRDPGTQVDSVYQLQQAHKELVDASPLFATNETAYETAFIEKLATVIADAAEDAEAGMAIKREVTLGKLAESYQIRQDSLGNLSGLDKAVAEHAPAFAGGYRMNDIARSMENQVRDMSPQEVQNFASNNPQAAHTLADAISARTSLSPKVANALPQITRYLDSVGANFGKVNVNVNMEQVQTSLDNLAQKSSRDRLNLAVKVNQLRGAELYRPEVHGTGSNTPDNYRGTIQRFAPGPAINAQQGGATMAKRHVVWGDEPWPFRPIYGLLYLPSKPALPMAATPSSNVSVDAQHGTEINR